MENNDVGRGIYSLVGYLHQKDRAVTETFVEKVVKKGLYEKNPKCNSFDYQFYKKCRMETRERINAPIRCINGRLGSWVMIGPMSNQTFEEAKLNSEFLELQDSLEERFPHGGSFLLIHVLVDHCGNREVMEWSEAVEHGVRETREVENECPYKQTPITMFFNSSTK